MIFDNIIKFSVEQRIKVEQLINQIELRDYDYWHNNRDELMKLATKESVESTLDFVSALAFIKARITHGLELQICNDKAIEELHSLLSKGGWIW